MAYEPESENPCPNCGAALVLTDDGDFYRCAGRPNEARHLFTVNQIDARGVNRAQRAFLEDRGRRRRRARGSWMAQ